MIACQSQMQRDAAALCALLGALLSARGAAANEPAVTPPPATVAPLGQSIGFGLDIGGFSGATAVGLRVRFPLGSSFALNVRPMMLANEATPYGLNGGPRADIGGRIELIGQVYALAPGVRLYGGGGPQVFYSIAGTKNPKVQIGGGGNFGFELFAAQRVSLFIEVGGSTGADRKYGDGGSAVGGVCLYLR